MGATLNDQPSRPMTEADIAAAGDTRYTRRAESTIIGGNANSLTATGFYLFDSTSTNLPTADYWYVTHTQFAPASSGYATQQATSANGSGLVYQRTEIGSVWSAWAVMASASIGAQSTFSSTEKDRINTNIGSVRVVKKQVFTASGTYTPSANMLHCIIECVGGGGGGGGVGISSPNSAGAGGGGSGGYSRTYSTAATIGASQTVTIGAAGAASASGASAGGSGGNTSVGALCIANGGGGGGGVANTTLGQGGGGGASGTGDVVGSGQPGQTGIWIGSNIGVFGGAGASSFFGGGANGGSNAAGNAASNYGAGGGGASAQNTATTRAGGAGSAGFVVITEFCTA